MSLVLGYSVVWMQFDSEKARKWQKHVENAFLGENLQESMG